MAKKGYEKKFVVTSDHMKLLAHMNVGWEDCEYGAPSVDCKRPYGNSWVPPDICNILGWEFDKEEGPDDAMCIKARKIHEEMEVVLQLLLLNAATGISPGVYVRKCEFDYRDWRRA